MQGYGFAPAIEVPPAVDGWWGTPDVGLLDPDGTLTVTGRLDDCVRTSAGHVINPAAVAEALEGCPGVTDSAVVPLHAAADPALGVLVECRPPVSAVELRAHLARTLPAWSRPRVVETIAALPRLPSGRIDRRACIAVLERRRGGEEES